MFLSVLSVFVHQVEQKHRAQTVFRGGASVKAPY